MPTIAFSRRAARGSAALAWGLALAPLPVAASVTSSLELEVTAVAPGITGIAMGDRYVLDFTIDDTDLDTNASVGAGSFPGLVANFTASTEAGNTGSWDPGTGVFDLGASNFVTNAFGDNFDLQVRGTGFPDAGGPFHDFDLGFGWLPGITDSGTGDTFAEQLGLAPGEFDFAQVAYAGGAIRFESGLDYLEATVTRVPEPELGLGVAALAALAGLRRARSGAAARSDRREGTRGRSRRPAGGPTEP